MRRSSVIFNLHSDSWFLLLPEIVGHTGMKETTQVVNFTLPIFVRRLADPRKDQEWLREGEVPSYRSRLGPRALLSGVSMILSPFSAPPFPSY